MYDPSVVVFVNNHISIIRHEKHDYYRGSPLRERINPLRYQINFGVPPFFTINENGKWSRWVNNARWKLWGKRAYERKRRNQPDHTPKG